MIKIHAPRLLICDLKLKLIISKQRVSSSVPLQLIEKAPLLVEVILARFQLRTQSCTFGSVLCAYRFLS